MIHQMTKDEFNRVMAECKTINDDPSTECLGFIAQAVIDKNPKYFMTNFNVVFEKGCDNLDNYECAALWLEQPIANIPFALQRYAGIIDPAIDIMIPDFYGPQENKDIVAKILKEFNLDETNLVWVK